MYRIKQILMADMVNPMCVLETLGPPVEKRELRMEKYHQFDLSLGVPSS